jgi:phosphocarrier protein
MRAEEAGRTAMISRDFVINNRLGLHARPAAQVTQTAGKFQSEVWIGKNGRRVNAKSIMGVLMLAAGPGSTVTVDADGPDEAEAVAALGALIESGFGEGE